MRVESPAALFDQHFVVLVLWLCVGGAVWLLLSPAAFQRRALVQELVRVEAERQKELDRNRYLRRWRDGLESDPSVIEREARRQGYGLPNERAYRALPAERNALEETAWRQALRNASGATGSDSWTQRLRASVGPVLLVILGGTAAYLLYRVLRFRKPRRSARWE